MERVGLRKALREKGEGARGRAAGSAVAALLRPSGCQVLLMQLRADAGSPFECLLWFRRTYLGVALHWSSPPVAPQLAMPWMTTCLAHDGASLLRTQAIFLQFASLFILSLYAHR
jgi:hypothetical protein